MLLHIPNFSHILVTENILALSLAELFPLIIFRVFLFKIATSLTVIVSKMVKKERVVLDRE